MLIPTHAAASRRARSMTRRGLRSLLALLTTLLLAATALATAPSASAALTAVGPVDPTTNFPSWYQDANGLQLQPCLSGPPLCFAAPGDLVPPDGELFYNSATATVGNSTLTLALEGAYAAEGPGQEIVFSRIRFNNRVGLTSGATYKVTHPYGVDIYTADAAGLKNRGTDVGCLAPPCGTFAQAMSSRLGPFITWDTFGKTPALGGPPAGYVGDNVTPHAIAPVVDGVDYLRVEGPKINTTNGNWCPGRTGDINCVQTNEFVVEGKVIEGPSSAVTPGAVDFGHQKLATSSTAQTVTVTSRGASDLVLGQLALAGANPEDYALSADTCSGATVAPGSTCTAAVTFTPTLARASSASLTVPDNSPAGSHVVTLKGTTAPAATLDTTSMAFPSQKVRTRGVPQTVTVSNDGSADLVINAPTITGTGASSYSVTDNTCTTPITPGGSCDISVTFAPTVTGTRNATLNVSDNGPSTHTVALTGAGIAPTQNLSVSALGYADQAVGSTSAQAFVTVSNGGNASMAMQTAAITGVNAADFALGTNTCAPGLNVAPNDTCSVGVTFSPKAAGSRNATLTITSDAGTDTVALSGNGVAPRDTAAPSTPGTPTVRANGATGLTVAWPASTDNVGVDHYDVFRDGGATAIGSSPTATFADSGLAEASTHSYTVKAVDAAGNASAASASGSGRTADVTPPGAPTTVRLGSATTSAITVAWTAPADNVGVTGYRVYVDGSVAGTAATGTSFAHTGLAASSSHTYQVTAVDAAGNESVKSAVFSASTTAADTIAPTQTHSPLGGATGVAVTGNVTASFNEPVQGVSGTTFTLKNAAGTAVAAAVAPGTAANQWVLNPTADLAAGTTYTATLTGGTAAIRDTANNALVTASWTFTTAPATTTDTTKPTATVVPAANSTGASQTANITATFSEAVTGVGATTFTLKNTATGAAVAATTPPSYNATTRVATFDPSITLAADTKYTASLTAGIKDTAGNTLTATSWTFTTGPRPTVTARTPATNGTSASTTANLTATLSEAVSGVSGATFTLKNAAGTAIAGTVTYNATTRVATFDPTATLANDTKYTAQLIGGATAIRDAAGNTLSSTGATWSFTTGPAPTVTARTPAANAINVGRTANVTATFSEAVTGLVPTGSTTSTTVTLKNATTGALQAAAVTYNATTRVVTLNPTATLAANTKFTVTLTGSTTAIRDAIGNPLVTTTWSFTTGAA